MVENGERLIFGFIVGGLSFAASIIVLLVPAYLTGLMSLPAVALPIGIVGAFCGFKNAAMIAKWLDAKS